MTRLILLVEYRWVLMILIVLFLCCCIKMTHTHPSNQVSQRQLLFLLCSIMFLFFGVKCKSTNMSTRVLLIAEFHICSTWQEWWAELVEPILGQENLAAKFENGKNQVNEEKHSPILCSTPTANFCPSSLPFLLPTIGHQSIVVLPSKGGHLMPRPWPSPLAKARAPLMHRAIEVSSGF